MKNNKDSHRLYWMVKGSLIPEAWTQESIDKMSNDFFKRVWYNTETSDEGFDEAYNKRYNGAGDSVILSSTNKIK